MESVSKSTSRGDFVVELINKLLHSDEDAMIRDKLLLQAQNEGRRELEAYLRRCLRDFPVQPSTKGEKFTVSKIHR